jgi:hypothetical protein
MSLLPLLSPSSSSSSPPCDAHFVQQLVRVGRDGTLLELASRTRPWVPTLPARTSREPAANHGLRPTLAVTHFILGTCAPDAALQGLGGAGASAVHLVAVPDGFDRDGFGECGDMTAYLSRLEVAGSDWGSSFGTRPRGVGPSRLWSTTRPVASVRPASGS